MKIVLVKDDPESDWYTIEKAVHEHRQWFEQTGKNSFSFMDTARISNACVEGTAEEMIAIAVAIKERTDESFKRCAVLFASDGVHFWSPRNSTVDGLVSLEEADELANQILTELA